jgi:hypothetical protein
MHKPAADLLQAGDGVEIAGLSAGRLQLSRAWDVDRSLARLFADRSKLNAQRPQPPVAKSSFVSNPHEGQQGINCPGG